MLKENAAFLKRRLRVFIAINIYKARLLCGNHHDNNNDEANYVIEIFHFLLI